MIELTMSYAAAYGAAQWISRHTLWNNDPEETVHKVWDDANSDTVGAIYNAVERGGAVDEIDHRLYAAVEALPNRTLNGIDVCGWAEEALEQVAAGEDLDALCDLWSETSDLHWGRPGECGPECPALIPRTFSFATLNYLEMQVFAVYRRFGRRGADRVLDAIEVRRCLSEGRDNAGLMTAIARSIEMQPARIAV